MILVLIGIAFLYFIKKENMKAIKNKVQLVGRLGADPEMKIYGEDKKLANLRLAVNDRYKNVKGEWMDETQWFSLIAWSKLAIYVEKYLTKGAEVAVEGRLVNKSFTDKAGIKRSTTEIVLSEILILSKQKELQLKN